MTTELPPQGPQFKQDEYTGEHCSHHPGVIPEWDGYAWVCPSCILGYPPEDV